MACSEIGCSGCSCGVNNTQEHKPQTKVAPKKKRKGNFSKTFDFFLKIAPPFSLSFLIYYYGIRFLWQSENPLEILLIVAAGTFLFLWGLQKSYRFCKSSSRTLLRGFQAVILLSLAVLGWFGSFIVPGFINAMLLPRLVFVFIFFSVIGYLYLQRMEAFLGTKKQEQSPACACG